MIMPVLFGEGLRFSEHLGAEQLNLGKVETLETSDQVDIRYCVVK